MSNREYFIDQQGQVVYWVNDPNGACMGCCYDNKGDCRQQVPAQHTADKIAGLGCIRELKRYRKVKQS